MTVLHFPSLRGPQGPKQSSAVQPQDAAGAAASRYRLAVVMPLKVSFCMPLVVWAI
jgi:hypothetical protein